MCANVRTAGTKGKAWKRLLNTACRYSWDSSLAISQDMIQRHAADEGEIINGLLSGLWTPGSNERCQPLSEHRHACDAFFEINQGESLQGVYQLIFLVLYVDNSLPRMVGHNLMHHHPVHPFGEYVYLPFNAFYGSPSSRLSGGFGMAFCPQATVLYFVWCSSRR